MGSVLAFENNSWMLLLLNSPPPSQAFLSSREFASLGSRMCGILIP